MPLFGKRKSKEKATDPQPQEPVKSPERHLVKKKYYATGTAYYQDNMWKLAIPNEKWDTAKAEPDKLVKVYKYNFQNKPLELDDDPDYPGLIRIKIAGLKVGCINAEDSLELKKILLGEVKYIRAYIDGGKYKIISTNGDAVEMDSLLVVRVTVGYVD